MSFRLACVHSTLTNFEGQDQGYALLTENEYHSSDLRNAFSQMKKGFVTYYWTILGKLKNFQFCLTGVRSSAIKQTLKSTEITADIVILHW